MQIRCTYCQTMFAVSREETLAALEHMEEENLKFYDAHCLKCRRANRIERLKLELSYPGWRDEIKKMTKEVKVSAQPAVATPAATVAPNAGSTTSPKKKHSHKPAGKPVDQPVAKAVNAPAKVKSAPAKADTPAKAKPVAKITKKAVSKPVTKPAAKVTKKPATKTAPKPAKKPVAKTATRTVKKPAGGTKKK